MQTRWLDEEQQIAWRSLLQMSVTLKIGLDADLARFGIDLSDYEILVLLSESADGQIRMSDLAERSWMTKSRLTYKIDKLVADGSIERVDCDTDKRGAFARITSEGRALLDKIAPEHVESVRQRVVDRLDRDEFLALGALSRRVVAED